MTIVVFPILYTPSQVFRIVCARGSVLWIFLIFSSCLYVTFEFSQVKFYVFWYTQRLFCSHVSLLFVTIRIYSINIPLTPSVCAMNNACSPFSSSFRQHKCKGSVSSFLVSVTWNAVLTFALNTMTLNGYTIIKVEYILLYSLYCYVRP
jgi:hypothetical protein